MFFMSKMPEIKPEGKKRKREGTHKGENKGFSKKHKVKTEKISSDNASEDVSKKTESRKKSKLEHRNKNDKSKERPEAEGQVKSEGDSGVNKKPHKSKFFQTKKKPRTGGEVLDKKARKAAKLERKAQKPHAKTVAEANRKLWAAPLVDLPKDKQQARMAELLTTCKGKVVELAQKHDTSRVLQRILKYGSKEQREAVLAEAKGHVYKLCLHQYGHNVLIKLLSYVGPSARRVALDELSGKFQRAALSSYAAPAVDYLFESCNAGERQEILAEFYGSEISLQKRVNSSSIQCSLATLLEKKDEEARLKVLGEIEVYLDKAVSKQLLMFRHFHSLLQQYMTVATEKMQTTMLEKLLATIGDTIAGLHHSPAGADVLCTVLTMSNAKQRKDILKALKSRVVDFAQHPDAVKVLYRALAVVDDTTLLHKCILTEILEAVEKDGTFPLQRSVAKVFLVALAHQGSWKHYFAPSELPLLVAPAATSKKPIPLRQRQLCIALLPSLAKTWSKEENAENFRALATSFDASGLLVEGLLAASALRNDLDWYAHTPATTRDNSHGPKGKKDGSKGGKGKGKETAGAAAPKLAPAGLTEKDKAAMEEACELLCNALRDVCESEEAESHLVQDAKGHFVLKLLLQKMQPDSVLLATRLCSTLVVHPALGELAATNRGGFVLTALLDACDKSPATAKQKTQLVTALKTYRKVLKSSQSPGVQLLLKALD